MTAAASAHPGARRGWFLRRFAIAAVLAACALAVAISGNGLELIEGLLWADEVPRGSSSELYVAPNGSDRNPGTMARPFATVDRARRAVQALPEPWNRDVIVWLRAGTYELSSTLELSTGDSGKNGYRVIYQPYGYGTPRQETVALSGGTRVTGWSDPDGDGIYEARTPSGAFRQLYVNGQRATRARAPNADADDYREDAYVPIAHWDSPGYEYDADPNEGNRRIGLKAADVPASLLKLPASQLHRVELVVQRKWAQNRVRIDSLSPEGPLTYLVPMEPERALFGFGPPRIDGQWAHLENAFVLLDAPGEWFLDVDAQKVYYKPRPGEDMKAAVVVAPRLETLLRLNGTLDSPVNNVVFRGIVFEYTNWTEPDERGFLGAQAIGFLTSGYTRGGVFQGRMPAAIHIQSAQSNLFERNVVQHTGGLGIALHSGTRSNQLIGNRIVDTSGTAVAVDLLLQAAPGDRRLTPTSDVVANNYIASSGRDYYDQVGIFLGYTDGTRVEHNDIIDEPYTAISVGWGWSTTPSAASGNIIRANRIVAPMRLMEDGAGIYTLSNQASNDRYENGLQIVANDVENVWPIGTKSTGPVYAMYLDNGTSNTIVRDNVFRDVIGRILVNGPNRDIVPENSDGTLNHDRDPPNAAQIARAAGLQDEYADVRPEAEPPRRTRHDQVTSSLAPSAFGDVYFNRSAGGERLKVGGDQYAWGFSTRVSGEKAGIIVDNPGCTGFVAVLGHDVASDGATLTFRIVDSVVNRPIAEFTMERESAPRSIALDVAGTRRLSLTNEGRGVAAWANARFVNCSADDNRAALTANLLSSPQPPSAGPPSSDGPAGPLSGAPARPSGQADDAGVPRLTFTWGEPVDAYWARHFANPLSPIYRPTILGPDPVIRVPAGSDLQAVLDERCPLAGCTLFLEDGVYGRLRIIGRSNVHIRGQSRDGVRLRGVQIASCDGAIGPAGSYTRIDQAIAANEEWAFECVRNRQRSFSFANLTFDGRGDILAWDGVDHLVTNAALVTRTAADVVVEDAHVTGYKDGGSVHDGVIMGNYHTDGLLVRRVVFDDGPGTYVFADGCFGCAVLDSQTGYSRAGHFVMFVNDDATDDINQNGRYDEDELRLSRYIIFRGNTVGHTNAYAFSVQGAFSLIENNTTTGWVSDFALFQTRRPFNHPPGTYVYKHFGHVVRNNTIDSAFDFVRFDMPDNCREVPSLSPDECLQAGQLTVANNSMANESRLIEDILWTRGNMPAHLADFWPAEWPKHELIVATRNTGGWAGGRPATRTESR